MAGEGAGTLADRYARLVSELATAKQGDDAGDTLEVAAYAVNAVVNFLDADPSCGPDASIVLWKLANALNGLAAGSHQGMFAPPQEGKKGRPVDPTKAFGQAYLVATLNLLLEAYPRGQRSLALQIMNTELRAAGMSVTAAQILEWRKRLRHREGAPPESLAMLDELTRRQKRLSAPADLEAVRQVVRRRLKQVNWVAL